MAQQDPRAMLAALLQPWREALANPAKAQQDVLSRFLKIYAQTEYGEQHKADKVASLDEYRQAFPVSTYDGTYKPLMQRVMAGEVRLLLNEELIGWAITRGTTKGASTASTPKTCGSRS